MTATEVRPYDGQFGAAGLPASRKGRADLRRLNAVRSLREADTALSVPDAVWRVVGPEGLLPGRKFRSPAEGGDGAPRPSDAKLVEYWTRWCASVAPDEMRAAAAREQLRLIEGARPAMDVFLDVSSGRLERFKTPVIDRKTGEHVGDAIDAKAADVSRRASERHLESVGVLPRQFGSAVTQVNAGAGTTVNVVSLGDGLRQIRARGQARRARRVPVEVRDGSPPPAAVADAPALDTAAA